MLTLNIKTSKSKQIIDITERINNEIRHFSIKNGLLHAMVLHTTTALTTADLDPGTDLDMLDAFEHMIPQLAYRHAHNPAHVGDHILSSLIGTSITLPIEGGKLILGTWQRVVLIEFDGPKERTLSLMKM